MPRKVQLANKLRLLAVAGLCEDSQTYCSGISDWKSGNSSRNCYISHTCV